MKRKPRSVYYIQSRSERFDCVRLGDCSSLADGQVKPQSTVHLVSLDIVTYP